MADKAGLHRDAHRSLAFGVIIHYEHILLVVRAGEDRLARNRDGRIPPVGIEGDGRKRADRRFHIGRQRDGNIIQAGLHVGGRRQRGDRAGDHLVRQHGDQNASLVALLEVHIHVLRHRGRDLHRAVFRNHDRRLRRRRHAAAHQIDRGDRTRAGRGDRTQFRLGGDLLHGSRDLRKGRGLLRLGLRYAGLRLRQRLLRLGHILLGGGARFKQRLRVVHRLLRLLHANPRRFDRAVGRGLGRIVGLLQRAQR